MKISKNWLCEEFVDISGIPEDLFLQRMTDIGHSVQIFHAEEDTVFDFDIPANRPDFFSVIGIGREIAAVFSKRLPARTPLVRDDDADSIYTMLDADIWAEDLCNRFTAAMVTNVRNGSSPDWMKKRLESGGIQSQNLLCDIACYVMLEYGQPVLAIDYRSIVAGQISVRESYSGELFTAADGKLYTLPQGIPVLDSGETIIAAAGVIPGQNVLPAADTETAVFIAGSYPAEVIRSASAALDIRTPASQRFSMSTDPLLTMPAILRVCELVQKLDCGKVMDGRLDLLNYVPNERMLPLDIDTINRILGTTLSAETVITVLRSLEIPTDGISVTIPSRYPNLTDITDLAAEIGRIYKIYAPIE